MTRCIANLNFRKLTISVDQIERHMWILLKKVERALIYFSQFTKEKKGTFALFKFVKFGFDRFSLPNSIDSCLKYFFHVAFDY
ncbi:Basic phospholipase A2 Tbo-G6D49 [Trichinella spiralis]|uniref:Basic phospholipase A2 Tbo-G6D49 n=1 Tax=Trichinella spiralis TaxID=6334 RepID=A0ABR3KMI0_TRISP